MRKRLMAVAAIGLLFAGAWLGNIFRGFGLGGSGTGAGDAEAPSPDTQVNLTTDGSTTAPTVAPTTETSTTVEESPDVLTVLIAEDIYQFQSGSDATASFAPSTLAEIVAQAKSRPGDTHGIRVRLRFRRNAHTGATSDLYAALQEAGIPREQIIEATGFVE